MRDAVDTWIRSRYSRLPIVDEQNRLSGVFSNREDTVRFLLNLDVNPIAGSLLTWHDLNQLPGSKVIGATDVPTHCGSIILALAGDDQWPHNVRADDILIAGSVDVISQLPADRQPCRVILVNGHHTECLRDQLATRGIAAVIFSGKISDPLFSLTKQVHLTSLSFAHGVCVGANDLLEDVCDLSGSHRRAIPVIDDANQLVGIVAGKDLKSPPRRKAILVDRFESD